MRSRRASFALALALVLLGLLGPGSETQAHTRSLSYSSWRLGPSEVEARARIPRLELTRLGAIGHGPPASPAIGQLLSRSLVLTRGGEPCTPLRPPRPRAAPEGWAAHAWTLGCPAAPGEGGLVLSTRLMLDVAPSHLHFARVELPDGRVVERVLSSAEPTWDLSTPSSRERARASGTSLPGYVLLGIEHIVTGWDHLAFVLALLLLASGIGEVARLVTGFTVAHSVTLAIAVLGWVHPQPAAVEAVIGFSVFLVATENAWLLGDHDRRVPRWVVLALLGMAALAVAGVGSLPWIALCGLALFTYCHFGILRRAERPERWRAALAFAFGLVHGFGFAGILSEMALPTARLVPALFGFNVGVEVGQVAVVVLAWPLVRAADRAARGGRGLPISELGSAAIAAVGLFWFVTRAFGH